MLNLDKNKSYSIIQLSKLKENSEEKIAYYKSIVENNDLILKKD